MAFYKSRAEAGLRDSSRYNQAILDNMDDGVITFNDSGQIQSCNKAAQHIFGVEGDDAWGATWKFFARPRRESTWRVSSSMSNRFAKGGTAVISVN